METVDTIDKPLTYHMDLGEVRQQIGDTLPRFKNVAEPERWASMVGGGSLVAWGLARRDIPGLLMAAVGGMLFHRGSSAHCTLYEKLGVNTRR